MASRATAHPPRARMAFRVGVVGHRLNRLPQDEAGLATIDVQVRAVLEAVAHAVSEFRQTPEAAFYDAAPPLLRAVSPLAEGADRILAAAALDHGYELCVPMPFTREEFEKDFSQGPPGSLEAFRGLLERAQRETALTTFELDQPRTDEAAAYGAAGRLVVNQSDLLVAIWDGRPAQGGGGTVATMEEAVSFRVPVLRIDACAPYGWSLIRSLADLKSCIDRQCAAAELGAAELRKEVADIVRAEIALPRSEVGRDALYDPALAEEPAKLAGAYFGERQPRLNIYCLWKPFRDLVGDFRLSLPRFLVRNFLAAAAEEWPVEPEEKPKPAMADWVNRRLRPHYAWADGLADYYADAHRSGFIATSMLAALAVILALLSAMVNFKAASTHDPRLEITLISMEFAVLVCLLTTIRLGNVRRWHERWLEYRMLAEWVRQLRFMIPMGGGRPLMRTPAHLAVYGDPLRSWIYWQVRAIARETGIPTAEAGPGYASECLAFLAKTIGDHSQGQLCFHRNSMRRSERIHHRLHVSTAWLVGITIAGVVVHLGIPLLPQELVDEKAALTIEAASKWLLLPSAGLPALGAALANINNQGEFARLSKRSRAMADAFTRFRAEGDRLRSEATPRMAEVTALASKVATSMVEEVVDWRIVAIDLPHDLG